MISSEQVYFFPCLTMRVAESAPTTRKHDQPAPQEHHKQGSSITSNVPGESGGEVGVPTISHWLLDLGSTNTRRLVRLADTELLTAMYSDLVHGVYVACMQMYRRTLASDASPSRVSRLSRPFIRPSSSLAVTCWSRADGIASRH